MNKTIFEQMGGSYTQHGDYLLPDLRLPEEEQQAIGVWGQRHLQHIRKHRKALYTSLLIGGKLNSYLADIDRRAEEMHTRLVKQMTESEGITEELKADDMMAWVRKMNGIHARAREIVDAEMMLV